MALGHADEIRLAAPLLQQAHNLAAGKPGADAQRPVAHPQGGEQQGDVGALSPGPVDGFLIAVDFPGGKLCRGDNIIDGRIQCYRVYHMLTTLKVL